MKKIARVLVIAWAVVLAGAVAAHAQQPSLAEVARQTAETRKAKDKASKTYTNADLKGGALTVTGSATKPAESEAKTTAAPTVAPSPADEAGKRVKELRAYVADQEQEARRLEQRVRELNEAVLSSFYQEQRDALVRERDAALDGIRKLQLDILAQAKAANDLEAAAKAAPPRPSEKPQ